MGVSYFLCGGTSTAGNRAGGIVPEEEGEAEHVAGDHAAEVVDEVLLLLHTSGRVGIHAVRGERVAVAATADLDGENCRYGDGHLGHKTDVVDPDIGRFPILREREIHLDILVFVALTVVLHPYGAFVVKAHGIVDRNSIFVTGKKAQQANQINEFFHMMRI